MEVLKKTVKVARTRNGVPCLWESLIDFEDLKRATIIWGKDGKPKKAVYLNEYRDKQALVPIEVGDFISKAFEDAHGIALSVFLVVSISAMSNEADVLPVYRKSSLIEAEGYPEEYADVINTTIDKLYGKIGVVAEKYTRETAS